MPVRAVVLTVVFAVVLPLSAARPSDGIAAVATMPGGGRAVGVASPASWGYVAPLAPLAVVRAFTPPPDVYAPGHLGVDLAARSGQVVRCAGSGVVRFAGPVAGRGVVIVLHPDGVSTEYEPVAAAVSVGDVVLAGDPVGHVVGRHRGCPAGCLHWGARRAGRYIDPLRLLRPLGPVRLLPWPRDG